MTPDKSLEELFSATLELADPVERAHFLAEACAGDATLREKVEKLVSAHEEAAGFLFDPSRKSQLPTATKFVEEPIWNTEKAGDRIGRYKLLQQIGEGGCGVVYMAEQEEPVRRRVALKVIKLGMDTKQVIARFDAERQALALMDHPNIAKVLDAGATETGRPYFVMELIRGIKITDFCDEHKVSTEERLRLFIQVCQAIQHAHQKGIIHRDIKPSNILVTVNDGVPVPKVIDFGIAKAAQGRLTDQTLFTAFEQFIGTPAYMSPEQAVMTTLDIDTRSDIYSLGVLLYELLTGRPPFDQKELLEVGLDEMRRTIREVEPVKPSSRLTQELSAVTAAASADASSVPSDRARALRQLTLQVRGDLDWIVMKCLEKDRTRRYETANGLATDLQRHLRAEPIAARPPSRLYELRKTVQRHKLIFGTASILIIALTLGAGLSTWQAIRATRAEREQARLRRDAEQAQKKSEEVARFLTDTLGAAGPIVARGRDASLLRELLGGTETRIEKELGGQPEVQGDLLAVLADSYHDIGETTKAIFMNERALSSYRRVFAGNHLKIALALGHLGVEQSFTGRTQVGSNNAWLGLQMARALGDEKTVAIALARYARSFEPMGAGAPAAVPYLREAVEILRKQGTNQLLMSTLSKLADCVTDDSEAVAITRDVLRDSIERHGEEDTFTAYQHYILGQRLINLKQYSEAEAEIRKALQLWRKVFSPNHPHRTQVLSFLIWSLALQKQFDAIEKEIAEERTFSPTNRYCDLFLAALKITTGELPVVPTNAVLELESRIDPKKPSFDAAIMLARTGRFGEYQRCCQVLLSDAQKQRGSVEQSAKAALLFPPDAATLALAGELADSTVEHGMPDSSMPWPLSTKALAEYRRGNFSSAIDLANRALAVKDLWRSGQATACCILALAYAAQGDALKAHAALSSAEQAALQYREEATALQWPPDEYWVYRDWIMADILKREALQRLSQAAK